MYICVCVCVYIYIYIIYKYIYIYIYITCIYVEWDEFQKERQIDRQRTEWKETERYVGSNAGLVKQMALSHYQQAYC